MRMLGAFREFVPDVSLPSVRDALGQLDDVERRRAGIYLVLGHVIRSTMERLPDVIDGEPVFLSSALLTDGVWYWRRDLAHYVLKYGVGLPKTFLDHAASHQWETGRMSEDDLRQIATTVAGNA